MVDKANIHKQTVVHWKESMKRSSAAIEKAKKVEEAIESQFAVQESEKTAFSRSLKEAKVAQDKVVALAALLKFEQED